MVYLSAGLALAWTALAFWQPTTTWHLGPVVVAMSVAVVHRSLGPLSRPAAMGAAVAGLTNAGLAILVLAVFDKLRGPALGFFPNALVESIVFAIVGAVVGALIGMTGKQQ